MEVSVLITLSPQAEKLQEKLENQPIAEEEQIPGSKSQCLAYLEVGEVQTVMSGGQRVCGWNILVGEIVFYCPI